MTRYFVDTNCLIGMTFFHDRWHRDVESLYENNQLWASDAVLWEYCNRKDGDPPMPEDPSEVEITTDAEDGVYGRLRMELERELPYFHREIDRLQRDGLEVDDVVETFIEHFGVREQAEPQIREYFEDYFEERALIARQAKRAVRELVDRILHTSEENKKILLSELCLVASQYHEMEKTREDIEYGTEGWIQEEDFKILLDAIKLAEDDVLSQMVTGDGGYLHAEDMISERYGLSIGWAGNEVYTDELVHGRKVGEKKLKGYSE